MNRRKTVADVVNCSPELQEVIKELRENNFLLENVLYPLSYIRDTTRIEASCKKEKSRINAIAMGMSVYSDYLMETVSSILRTGKPESSRKVRDALRGWKRMVRHLFPLNYKEIEETSQVMCQYLEYTNRQFWLSAGQWKKS